MHGWGEVLGHLAEQQGPQERCSLNDNGKAGDSCKRARMGLDYNETEHNDKLSGEPLRTQAFVIKLPRITG